MTWLRRLSITARITIGSLIVAALFGLVAVVVIRVGVSSILHNATVTLLNNDVTAPAASVLSNPSGPFDLPGGGQELAVVDGNGVILDSTLPTALEDRIDLLLSLPPSAFLAPPSQRGIESDAINPGCLLGFAAKGWNGRPNLQKHVLKQVVLILR